MAAQSSASRPVGRCGQCVTSSHELLHLRLSTASCACFHRRSWSASQNRRALICAAGRLITARLAKARAALHILLENLHLSANFGSKHIRNTSDTLLQAPSAFPQGVQVLAGYLRWQHSHTRAALVLQLDLRSSQARGCSQASIRQGAALLQATSARCACRFS